MKLIPIEPDPRALQLLELREFVRAQLMERLGVSARVVAAEDPSSKSNAMQVKEPR